MQRFSSTPSPRPVDRYRKKVSTVRTRGTASQAMPGHERKDAMPRRRTLSLVGLAAVAVLAVGLVATTGTAGNAQEHAYKIFMLPKTTSIPVFTQNAIGGRRAA